MKFSKIGKHTIRCVISEQEIQDLGYTIEEIMSNGERTQEFMNQIFDMAEQSLRQNLNWASRQCVLILCQTIRWHLRFRSIRDRMK